MFYSNNYVFINYYSDNLVSKYLLSIKSFNYYIFGVILNILLDDGGFMLKFYLSSDVKIYPSVLPIIIPEYELLVKFIWFLILVISLY